MPTPLLPLALLAGVLAHRHHRTRPQKVFFSFHYADIFRVMQIKKAWVTHRSHRAAGFFDHSLEEVAKTKGAEVVRGLIDEALEDTEVTAVLIGAKTARRRWVNYEIKQSALRGNRLLAIQIHNLKGSDGRYGRQGENPFANFDLDEDRLYTLADFVPEYDWSLDDGYHNFGEWIRESPTLRKIQRQIS